MNAKTKNYISVAGLIVWVCCLVFYLYEFFLRTFVGTVAQNIIHDLHLSSEEFALMGAAYYVTYSMMQIPVGFLTDRFGAKKTVIFAMITCALSLLLFSISQNFVSAFFSRFLMGLGSSFGFVSLLVVITNWFPQHLYATFIGISQFVGTLGPLLAAGPLVTVLKNSSLGWRSLFIRVSIFGFLFALLMLVLFKSKPRNNLKELIVLERPKKILLQLGSLFKNKQAWLIGFYSALSYECIDFLAAAWGTFYLQSRGLSLQFAGYTISAGWLGFAVGCPLITFFSECLKRRKPVLIMCSLIGITSTSLITYFELSSPWLYSMLFFLIGMAASSLNLGIAIIIEHVEISVKALALGFNNGLIILFGAIIPVCTSFLIHLPKDSAPTPENFIPALTFLPGMFLIALIIATFFIKETFCKPQRQSIFLKPN